MNGEDTDRTFKISKLYIIKIKHVYDVARIAVIIIITDISVYSITTAIVGARRIGYVYYFITRMMY